MLKKVLILSKNKRKNKIDKPEKRAKIIVNKTVANEEEKKMVTLI